MLPVTLEGDTLGKKRHHFNKLVNDAIANKHYELCNISADDRDIDNLLKIHIASKTRNAEYIIEVMKSKDMLYAATAVKQSTWLITEQQYEHIINPEYLHTQLLPSMNTKIFNKLMLHIRLNLKDESRVESFYEYLKEKDSACKWLQNCSIPFIQNVILNERPIPLSLFKRLCRRSASFIAYCARVSPEGMFNTKQEILFMLKSHTLEVMQVLEPDIHLNCPELGKKKTETLMKRFSQKVCDNFEKYVYSLDLSVVAKYINRNDIKSFLEKQTKKSFGHYIIYYEHLKHFLKKMPETGKYEFVKKTFIDKTELAAFYPQREKRFNSHIKCYQWYEFVSFNEALTELKKVVHTEHSSSERCAMVSVLIICARKNQQQIKSLLELIKDRHINESFKFKIQFVHNLLAQISSHEFDVETWNVLDQLFHSMEVYTESENDVQVCLESIILYRVLHDEPVPGIVEQKTTFNTFKKFQRKLNQNQNEKMFTYLFNFVLTKIQIENIANESDFSETIVQLKNALTLIKDWKKDINKYLFIFEEIQQLIKIRQRHKWEIDMSCLYNVKKSWRKHMFMDSLSLCLCEETCLNALKHMPQLLMRHDKEIDALRTNDAVLLQRLLAKLRVYWLDSLAKHWTDAYLLKLNKPTGQKAVIKGLFALLHQNQIIDFAKQYVPDGIKVNWGDTVQNEISIRKNIAKHLHVTRPLIPFDVILWYAKGDYLQHTVPSLNAILPNLNEAESREYLPKLLNAPVSMQKFGIHLAATKLKCEDLKSIFLKLWKTYKNLTTRSVLFKHTYNQICKANNPTDQKDLWQILSSFIDNLTAEESAGIYKIVGNVENVPESIQVEFYMKSYEFLSSLPASSNCESHVKGLIQYAPKMMDSLDGDFVVNKILSPIVTKFCSYKSEVLEVFACYILCGKSDEDQIQRFRKVVEPAIDEAFQLWDSTRSGEYYIRDNFNNFLNFLCWNYQVYYLAKKTLPVQLFVAIKTKVEKKLSLLKNYVLYTSWKLVTEYVKLMDEHKTMLDEIFESSHYLSSSYEYRYMANDMVSVWKDIHSKLSPLFGTVIVKCLKEDTKQYNNISSIYCPFTDALQKCFDAISFQDEVFVLETLKHMLNNDDFMPCYLLVSKATPKLKYKWEKCEIRSEICQKLESHPSKAVRMQYFNDFQNLMSKIEK